jgi:hypothetical protein
MGWDYYVYTILDILYCKDNLNSTCEYIVGKERKHFNSYDGNIDSDESEYEQAVNEYYEKQLTKFDKKITIINNSQYLKPIFKEKYERDIYRSIPKDSTVLKVVKIKYATIIL